MALLNHICNMAWSLPETHSGSQGITNRMLEGTPQTTTDISVSPEARTFLSPAKIVEERWRRFFTDPSEWWDHRSGKTSTKFPDFKHKKTQEALWLNERSLPQWVEAELAAMTPGTLQLPLYACNKKLAKYVDDGHDQKALELFHQMQQVGMNPDRRTFNSVLKACANLRRLEEGKEIHMQVLQSGCASDLFVCTSLVDMYAKCGSMEEALGIFNSMPQRDVVTWNAIILGLAKCGQGNKALELYRQMLVEQVEPAALTFVGVLKACASIGALEEGKRVHAQIIDSSCDSDSNVVLGNSLVHMYAKCGSVEDALNVFGKMPVRDVVSWNSLIQGLVKCGEGYKALEVYQQMRLEGMKPNHVTFLGVLNACASVGALEEGRTIHGQIIESVYKSHVFVGNSLVNMYAKCGSISDAEMIFQSLTKRDSISWNAMILAYAKFGQGQKALELYKRMKEEGGTPDNFTFVGVLGACASIKALEEGRLIHAQIIQSDFDSDVFVDNSLVDMYAKCGSIEDAERLFYRMPKRDLVSWNVMIHGYIKCGQAQKALGLYQKMEVEGLEADTVTFVGVLNACSTLGALKEGMLVHAKAIRSGCDSHPFVGSVLVDMYAKCGSIEEALTVFNKMATKDIVAWNAVILGHVKCGHGRKAFELYIQMQEANVVPDNMTFVAALNACAGVAALAEGRRLHSRIIQKGWESDVFVSNALIDMYSKCGSVEDAEKVFQTLRLQDVVSCNSMLGGYAMHGYAKEALDLFEQMREGGLEIDSFTFTSLLSACSHAGLVDEGLHYFESLPVYGIAAGVKHYACMVDLLGRSGRLQEAQDVVGAMTCEPDATVWMALLSACRLHGNVELGEDIAKRVLEMDPENAAGYVMLANIYASAYKWDKRENLQSMRIERGVQKEPGRSWIQVNDEVHSFVFDDHAHPQISDIHAELERLSEHMKQAGYVPNPHFAFHDVEDEEEVSHLRHHSERLAIAFGLMNTPDATPLHVVKNLRICGDCHAATKFISVVTQRQIVVRDATRFHHFKDGICSCKDCW